MADSVGQAPWRDSRSLQAVLVLHDEDFINAAYALILSREADSDGLGNYLLKVRAGASKASVIAALARSAEAAEQGVDAATVIRNLAQFEAVDSLWSRFLRRVTPGSSATVERQLRIIDNRLYLIEKALSRLSAADARLVIDRPERRVQAREPGHSHAPDAGSQDASAIDGGLSPMVRRTLADLEVAVVRRRGH